MIRGEAKKGLREQRYAARLLMFIMLGVRSRIRGGTE
jgi:hypothetical protein